ncbi:MAG: hypothetical protein WAU68_09145 [Vitreimonas sp.]
MLGFGGEDVDVVDAVVLLAAGVVVAVVAAVVAAVVERVVVLALDEVDEDDECPIIC